MKNFYPIVCLITLLVSFEARSQDGGASDGASAISNAGSVNFGPLGTSTGRYIRPQYSYWQNVSRGNSINFVGASLGYEFENQDFNRALEFDVNYGYKRNNYTTASGYDVRSRFNALQFLATYKLKYEITVKHSVNFGWSLGPTLYVNDFSYTGPSNGSDDNWDWVFSTGPVYGYQYKINDKLTFDVGYRYLFSWGLEWYGQEYDHADVHLLTIGLNYSF